MADLDLRLGRDVLVIANGARERLLGLVENSGHVEGIDLDLCGAATLAIEPEVIAHEILQDVSCGAQCVVLNVFDFSPASLRRMDCLSKADDLAKKTTDLVAGTKLQHPLIQVFPSQLPLDESSKTSLNEHCEQYKFVAKLFENLPVDGFLCVGFESEAELKCALTGIRKASLKTIVYEKQAKWEENVEDLDFAPASSSYFSFDYSAIGSLDSLLDESLMKAKEGIQFLNVRGASASKTAAVFAVTNGIMCS